MIFTLIKAFIIGWIIIGILTLLVSVYSRIEDLVGTETIKDFFWLSVAAIIMGGYVLSVII